MQKHSPNDEIKTKIYTFSYISNVDVKESCFLMQSIKFLIKIWLCIKPGIQERGTECGERGK